MSRIELRNERRKKSGKLVKPEENSCSYKIKDNKTTKITKTAQKEMKSGSWKALNETGKITKITRIAKNCKFR